MTPWFSDVESASSRERMVARIFVAVEGRLASHVDRPSKVTMPT
jgi:hypothetical protein